VRNLTRIAIAFLAAGTAGLAASYEKVAQSISPERIESDVRFLSHDLLEGRGSDSRGGELARLYIRTRMAQTGVAPGAGNGSYDQPVAFVSLDPQRPQRLDVRRREKTLRLLPEKDFALGSSRYDTEIPIDAEVVFAGFGIQAPEQSWDDFAATDVRGKVVLVMVNDPPSDDPAFFGGKALTYYGRWTYKFEKAAALGAAGVLLIHTTPSTGYGWDVVVNSFSGERLFLADDKPEGLSVRAWLTEDAARRLAALGGHDLDALRERARARGFKAVPLGVRLQTRLTQKIRRLESANVVGLIPGSDPERADEPVIFTAHWDHLGVGREVNGDKIYNGAYDNATGVAALLALGEAFVAVRDRLARPVVLLATTAEEQGLLGAEHYARHPALPLNRTVAVLNLDAVNVWGPTRDLTPLGAERSTLIQVLEEAAGPENLRLLPDAMPEQGFYFRSDHFPFAKAGVPSASVEAGLDYVDRPEGWGKETVDKYIAERYHRPADEMIPGLDFRGTAQVTRFAFRAGYLLATSEVWPDWIAGQEFQRRR
jgi:Zn-dependent M28 family amino/carboxypeptidase